MMETAKTGAVLQEKKNVTSNQMDVTEPSAKKARTGEHPSAAENLTAASSQDRPGAENVPQHGTSAAGPMAAALTKGKRRTPKSKKTSIAKMYEKEKISAQAVNAALRELGIAEPKKVNPCLKAGIQRKLVRLDMDDPLDQVIAREKCSMCDEVLTATMRDILYQPIYGGNDYDMGRKAPIRCTNEDCEFYDEDEGASIGYYVTEVCCRRPTFNSGKSHNHCIKCPGFGQCIGDYREAHCRKCGDHYFQSGWGFPCPCKGEVDYDAFCGI